MRTTLSLACALAIAACGGTESPVSPDAGVEDPEPDAAPPDAAAPACDVSGLDAYAPVAVTVAQILPSETARPGETIQDTLQGTLKRHYLMTPDDTTGLRDELFVFLAGSGGEPHHYTSILEIAAAAGYRSISLAYDNETTIESICGIENDPVCGPTNPDCEEGVRLEVIYGRSFHDSPCFEVADADSIEHRLLRLIQYIVANAPASGADAWLTADGTAIDWSRVAIGGWSQGGGHSGMIARDHLVARTLFLSKGGDSTRCAVVTADPTECDVDGDGAISNDEAMVPSPWVHDPRATPGSREFGAIHVGEGAWFHSRETFEIYGMGAKADALDLDGLGPYPEAYADYGCAHVFSTAATPACGPTDFHASMAADGCLARDDAGIPLLAPAYYYALTVPVP